MIVCLSAPARIAFKIGISGDVFLFFLFLALYLLKEIYLVTVLNAFFFNEIGLTEKDFKIYIT